MFSSNYYKIYKSKVRKKITKIQKLASTASF